jgi:rhodanese-related sulfurtransferase
MNISHHQHQFDYWEQRPHVLGASKQLANTRTKNMHSDSPVISEPELAASLDGDSPPIVAEILGPQQFASGHLPGALNLPLDGLLENAARLLPDKAAAIVVYCSSSTCQNSHIAERKLRSLGYQNVRVFAGGKAAWKDAGRPLVAA